MEIEKYNKYEIRIEVVFYNLEFFYNLKYSNRILYLRIITLEQILTTFNDKHETYECIFLIWSKRETFVVTQFYRYI